MMKWILKMRYLQINSDHGENYNDQNEGNKKMFITCYLIPCYFEKFQINALSNYCHNEINAISSTIIFDKCCNNVTYNYE